MVMHILAASSQVQPQSEEYCMSLEVYRACRPDALKLLDGISHPFTSRVSGAELGFHKTHLQFCACEEVILERNR
jgi:hypothetical protein